MYIAPVDSKVLFCEERVDLMDAYETKFGEPFIQFNYVDFQRQGEKCSGEVYMEALRKAVQADEPTHIVSHRYSLFEDLQKCYEQGLHSTSKTYEK